LDITTKKKTCRHFAKSVAKFTEYHKEYLVNTTAKRKA
jgi:hypothetical protein